MAPYAALLIALLALAPIHSPRPHLGETFLLWFLGRLVLLGGSPYDPAAWVEGARIFPSEVVEGAAVNVLPAMSRLQGVTWPHPPWTVYLFVPFGALPVGLGTDALHLTEVAAGILAAVLIARLLPWPSSLSYGTALVTFALFQPFVMGVRGGQFVTVVLAGIAFAAHGAVRGGTLPLVVGALLVAMKPTVAWLFAPAVLALLVGRRAWRAIALASGALAALAIITFARHPEAIAPMTTGTGDRIAARERFATTWALAQSIGGDSLIVVALLLVSATAFSVVAVRLSPPDARGSTLLAASLVLSLAFSPYVQSYDGVALAPAAFASLLLAGRARPRLRALVLGATFIVALVLPWLAIVHGLISGTQAASGLVTLSFAPLLALTALAARGTSLRPTSQLSRPKRL